MKHELCFVCNAATGRAGRADDSIYLGAIGPWCESCYQEARDAVLDNARSDGALVDSSEVVELREEVAIRNCTIDHQMDELAALRERTRWRPIETFDLPDDDSAMLAIDGSPYMGARSNGEFWIDGNYNDSFHPTHWLPLPEAPR